MTKLHNQTCAIAETLNVLGDNWSWLIVREAFYGATRFSELHRNTGITKALLSQRLSSLVQDGILERENKGATGVRYEYQLTEKGRALFPVLVAMTHWADEHVFGPGREPVIMFDRKNGAPIRKITVLDAKGTPLTSEDVGVAAGPGASHAARRRISEAS